MGSQRLTQLFSKVLPLTTVSLKGPALSWWLVQVTSRGSFRILSTLKELLHSPKALQLHDCTDSSRGRGNRDSVCLSSCYSHISLSPRSRGCLTQSIPLYLPIEAVTKMQSFACPERSEDIDSWGRFVASSLLCHGGSIGPVFGDEIMEYKKNPWVVATALPTVKGIIYSKMKFCQLKRETLFTEYLLSFFWGIFSLHTYC